MLRPRASSRSSAIVGMDLPPGYSAADAAALMDTDAMYKDLRERCLKVAKTDADREYCNKLGAMPTKEDLDACRKKAGDDPKMLKLCDQLENTFVEHKAAKAESENTMIYVGVAAAAVAAFFLLK